AAKAAAVPAAITAAAPSAMPTSAAPSAMPTSAPGPAGGAPQSAMKADGPPSKPLMADRRRSDGCEAAGDEAAMPPAGSDGCESQHGRTDEEPEGGGCEDDERRRRRNDDGRRRQDHDRRWQ